MEDNRLKKQKHMQPRAPAD